MNYELEPTKHYSSMASKLLVVWAARARSCDWQGCAVNKCEGFDAGGFGGSVAMLQAPPKDLDGQFVHPAFHTSQAVGGGLFGCPLIVAEQGFGKNRQAVLLFVRKFRGSDPGGRNIVGEQFCTQLLEKRDGFRGSFGLRRFVVFCSYWALLSKRLQECILPIKTGCAIKIAHPEIAALRSQ